jgi:N-acetylmuramoyl-L-alanine amidase
MRQAVSFAVLGLSGALILVGTAMAPTGLASPPSAGSSGPMPLAGLVIALDPGHQLGNGDPRFATQMSQTKFNGNSVKGCNTTGTETPGGYPESTFTWKVALRVKRRLEQQGATVRLTRPDNSPDMWGPCVWKRGAFGTKVGADLEVSIHGDGAPANGHGFFIYTPASISGWTDDIAGSSLRAAHRMHDAMVAAGATSSTYISGGVATTPEMTTLNFSDIPIVLIEMGNMRNAQEAAAMESPTGQARYARWLVAGIKAAVKR